MLHIGRVYSKQSSSPPYRCIVFSKFKIVVASVLLYRALVPLRPLPLVVALSKQLQENVWAHAVAKGSTLLVASGLMNNNVNAEKSCCCHEFVMLPPSAVLAHNLQVRVSFSTADGARVVTRLKVLVHIVKDAAANNLLVAMSRITVASYHFCNVSGL